MIFIVHLRPCCSENKGWIVSYGLEAEKVVTVKTIEKEYIKKRLAFDGPVSTFMRRSLFQFERYCSLNVF